MKNAIAIAKKELNIYFATPIAYVMFTLFVVIGSYFFLRLLGAYEQASDVHAVQRRGDGEPPELPGRHLPQPVRQSGRDPDLHRALPHHAAGRGGEAAEDHRAALHDAGDARRDRLGEVSGRPSHPGLRRSEERRVGKEWRSRWEQEQESRSNMQSMV